MNPFVLDYFRARRRIRELLGRIAELESRLRALEAGR
jgi:BMFP domain-containing protein YqiC